MSKSSTASVSKTSQLPSKSAWAKGPPANTSTAPSTRSQSPAPSVTTPSAPTHSRRPSTLGQGCRIHSPFSLVSSLPGSPVTFGSIDDASAPISSSPSTAPIIKPDGIKTFGSVPASTNGKVHSRTTSFSTGTPPSIASTTSTSSTPASTSTAPSTSASAPSKPPKFDVRSLFQNKSADAPSTSTSTTPASPSNRPAPLPPTPSPMGSPYNTFRPQNGMPGPSPGVPRSPSFPRQMANGAVNGRPPPGGPPSAGLPAAMPSPRMAPAPHVGQPQPVPHGVPAGGVPVSQPHSWGYYAYYPTVPGMPPMDPNYPYQGWIPQHMPPQHHPPPGTPGSAISGLPMSPGRQQQPLHAAGTPTLPPAMPPNTHPPHTTPSPHTHTSSLSSVNSSTPSTPSTSQASAASRLPNPNASVFTPKRGVTIKSVSGQEVKFDGFKRPTAAPTTPITPNSPARRAIPITHPDEAKKKKEAEEQKEREEKLKKEAEEKAKKEAEEKAEKEAEDKAKKEAEEKRRAEEEARKKKEQEERVLKEERLRQEAEEKAHKEAEKAARKAAEEKEQREAEQRAKQEAEAKAKAEAEAAAAAAAATAATAAVAAAAAAAAAAKEAASEEREEGEVEEPEHMNDTDEAAREEAKDKVSDKATLRIDTALSAPEGKRRPGRLDLSGTKSTVIPAALPSALATARIIEDIQSIQYPVGISSPKPELNVNAKQGKFRYDREFLMQFMAICKEKPDSLPPLDAIGLEPNESMPMTRGGSHGHRHRTSSSSGMPNTARQPSVGLGLTGFQKPQGNPFNMGNFATAPQKLGTSEERFAASRTPSLSGSPAGMPFGRPAPMVRSSSQGGPGAHPSSGRTRSQRGNRRGGEKERTGGPGSGSQFGQLAPGQLSLEPVAPLEASANRWQPNSLTKKGAPPDQDSPEIVDRKVKSLLNKLTMERFDSISDQIITWANKSETEQDGRTLIQVIRLVFEKATDEAAWSEMYARLCRKMMEQISPNVHDDGIKNAEGKPITGGQLFRKYLLNRCQEDFERGWVAKEATAAAAASKLSEDEAAKAAAESSKDGESALYSDEYYAAQKAKRQGLGLIKFIGELFKLQMLTERIMHECIKKLLSNVENPEEEEIESLCKLVTTVGQILDTAKARAHMDVYFARMKELVKSGNVNSRMVFMLQDVIELRSRQWIPRNLVAAPATLAAIHEQAAKDRAAAEKEAFNRNVSMSRGGSRRGGDRGDGAAVGPDGWAVAGGPAARPPATKAGDLSQFGKIAKSTPMTFGPSSVFTKDKSKRDSTIRQSSTNMFSMLSGNPEIAQETSSNKGSRPPSRKNSIDLGQGGAPEPPQRRKLNLLPRSVPVDVKSESTPSASANNSDDEGGDPSASSMSVEQAKARIDEDLKEFFSVRDLGEAEDYFTKLPSEHRHLLVDQLVTKAVESKEADAKLVADLFDRAIAKNMCSPQSFEDGFTPIAEIIDDIAIDAPMALKLFAIMLKGAHLHEDEERRTRLVGKSMDSEKLVSLLLS
ncbi:uncharacterized protein BXZ73DRAFT_87857 [Epithele typhae]|uniref:uncharacterized protein n=1 Tax=Epithele typhae TaxID=378194 RepID=UPI00200820BD|nr:uncharacterized protein BXZ73DRAFT_87857 [Epithele typhae]KAH9942185.1 hypothetical protein BXZ73DRAFT_87857 [Epithele typhae]